eukprot:1643825-Rhodomonas_salina.3
MCMWTYVCVDVRVAREEARGGESKTQPNHSHMGTHAQQSTDVRQTDGHIDHQQAYRSTQTDRSPEAGRAFAERIAHCDVGRVWPPIAQRGEVRR